RVPQGGIAVAGIEEQHRDVDAVGGGVVGGRPARGVLVVVRGVAGADVQVAPDPAVRHVVGGGPVVVPLRAVVTLAVDEFLSGVDVPVGIAVYGHHRIEQRVRTPGAPQ